MPDISQITLPSGSTYNLKDVISRGHFLVFDNFETLNALTAFLNDLVNNNILLEEFCNEHPTEAKQWQIEDGADPPNTIDLFGISSYQLVYITSSYNFYILYNDQKDTSGSWEYNLILTPFAYIAEYDTTIPSHSTLKTNATGLYEWEGPHFGTDTTSWGPQVNVACDGWELYPGNDIYTIFTYHSKTPNTPQFSMNINGQGVKTVYRNGSVVSNVSIDNNVLYHFVYDGTYFQLTDSSQSFLQPSTSTPKSIATQANIGVSPLYARGDHVHNITSATITAALGFTPISAADVNGIPTSEKGSANGVAELDTNGKVPAAQLPSYVDDVLEYNSKNNFPATGETGKIYIDTATNISYRWGGTQYVEISSSLALGETSSTAFPGNRGKALETLTSTLADLAFKNTASASYRPAGTVTFNTTATAISGTASYTPSGSISVVLPTASKKVVSEVTTGTAITEITTTPQTIVTGVTTAAQTIVTGVTTAAQTVVTGSNATAAAIISLNTGTFVSGITTAAQTVVTGVTTAAQTIITGTSVENEILSFTTASINKVTAVATTSINKVTAITTGTAATGSKTTANAITGLATASIGKVTAVATASKNVVSSVATTSSNIITDTTTGTIVTSVTTAAQTMVTGQPTTKTFTGTAADIEINGNVTVPNTATFSGTTATITVS